ncbi:MULTISPECIES: flavin-containing monooxygenase [Nocardia]|uniref:NAD(P)/FAD-dependent oxidoreductase n=1 Tax=Nocardia implantans TaxID=3108168 RepID=A0ABU6ARS6_9NOCA|nr:MULTISPECIES: NAD(P)/FAD-dependent oxidoreductase [unclassified Nocardia]MEA3528069.1 NAD(P)/FAD-dependent oxidoreductase [Nocardia sp. CDC192]MEB3510179.1 NAD(P)/FAD-dependent oxidoreductase [Nocardia sp. CDC186]
MTMTSEHSASSTGQEAREIDAVVVGAGFAGLHMLYKLRELGFSVQVYEAGGGLGGTWYWNRYPGARVDVKSMYYNYSFDPELEQEWEWTEKYPPQPELLRYINHVADRFDLRKDVRLRTRVTAAVYDESAARWRISTDQGEVVSARFAIMATGCLSVAKMVEVPGIEAFRGRSFHTGNWPEGDVDFTGRRVAVIGTGASGVQVIPLVAEVAETLTVFQRTANYVLPAHNHTIDPEFQRAIKSRYRDVRKANRESSFGIAQPEATKGALEVSEEERNAFYRRVWEDKDSELVSMLVGFTDILADEAANETAAQFVRDRIAEIVTDPAVARILQPSGYPFGVKRPCLGTNYYETFNRPNVRLVDLRATPLTEVTESGLATTEENFEFDDIIYATGYDAMTGALDAIDIRGRGGVSLREKWAGRPVTYLGLAVAGFPNLFTITGPGSPAVLSNMLVSIEQHVDWVADAMDRMRSEGVTTMEAEADAEQEWTRHVDEVGDMTLYPKADSWYVGSNVPGKPRVMYAYIGGVGAYREKCDQVAADDYDGFTLTR